MKVIISGLTKIDLFEHLDSVLNIATVDGVLEPGSEVATMFSNLGHSAKLLLVTSGQVEEGKLVEIPLLLVGHLHYLVIAMGQSFRAESAPEIRAVQLSCHLDGNVKVTALQGEFETGLGVLNELQRNLWVTLLLQV